MTAEHYCFCELAPLYALGVLSEEEQRWVEAQIAACPELAEELAQYDEAVATIPYGVAPLSVNPTVKERLFQRLTTEVGQDTSPNALQEESQPVVDAPQPPLHQPPSDLTWAVRSQSLNWQPYWIPGVTIAILHANWQTQEVVGLLRAEPNTRSPQHRHAGVEEIYMLEGDLVVGEAVYGAGDYLRSVAGSAHAPYTNQGCMFFFRASMLDDYADRPLTMAAIGWLLPWVGKVARFIARR